MLTKSCLQMKKFLTFILITSLLTTTYLSFSQEDEDFGFSPSFSVQVYDEQNILYQYPWTGGINNAQINQIDLNNDDLEDIVLYDSHSNKLHCFIYDRKLHNYSYSPQYADYFPEIEGWINLIDYDRDGQKDIFTYNTGGIIVYKNTGKNHPEFELVVYPFIKSLYGNFETNVLVTNVDYPIIEDMDNDNDLDLVVFWGLGSYMQLHKNMSQERYGHSDSLVFELYSDCWGDIAESEESNTLNFDACNNKERYLNSEKQERHTGSTMLAWDINKDGNKDLILGDIDYPNFAVLINDNTSLNADFNTQINNFPSDEKPIELFSFPLMKPIDYDLDNDDDFVVSSFDPSFNKSRFENNIHLYKNNDNTYTLIDSAFLSGEMLDFSAGSKPIIYDLNKDGLSDLLVGNFGYLDEAFYENGFLKTKYVSMIAYLENVGDKTNPVFQLKNKNLGMLSKLKLEHIHPTISDIDDDGTDELLIGTTTGRMLLFEIASPDEIKLIDNNYLSVGVGYATPQFFDLNKDGKIDIVSGAKDGKLKYFENRGTKKEPQFTLVNENLGNVNVTNQNVYYFGHSSPCFFDYKGQTKLFCGAYDGYYNYYVVNNEDLNEDFTLIHDNYLFLHNGIFGSPAVKDLNADGYPELISGNYCGGLNFYFGKKPNPVMTSELKSKQLFDLYPNPSTGSIILKKNAYKSTDYLIKIYNPAGQLIIEKLMSSNEQNMRININKSGVYFVVVSDKSSVIETKKLIVYSTP